MSNTLKFGNGNWATKEGSTLAYNDENNNFKPLPFSFERDSSATVVNKDGLIETVGAGMPRIDYKDNSEGALLLEPSRTNLVAYSEDFSNSSWLKINGGTGVSPSITNNYAISPDGTQNASRVILDAPSVSASNISMIRTNVSGLPNPHDSSISFYIKSNTSDDYKILVYNGSLSPVEVIANNSWQRIELSTTVMSSGDRIHLGLFDFGGILTDSYADISIWGAQIEEGSYATSYIPTSGSAVTRLADECLKDDFSILTVGNSYTLFFDVDLNEGDVNITFFNMENSSGATSLTVRSYPNNSIRVYNNLNSQYPVSSLASSTNKWVVRIDGTSFKIFGAEGSLSGTLTTARDMGEGIFGRYSQTKINDFKVYNTALSDSESEALVN
jgi:hypothetical protein